MTRIINNRDFQRSDDGWCMIEPFGDHPNARAGIIQRIDGKAADSIVTTFNQQADDPNFSGMLVDHEHFKFDDSKESVAYGWLMRLQKRPDGIYGQIRWTTTGHAAVDGGDYRFFSTEYDPADCELVENGDPKIVRPLRLDGLTLCNVPNNQGGKPITNRSGEAGAPPAVQEVLDRESASVAANHFNSFVKTLQASKRCTWQQAWDMAKLQKPSLYAQAGAQMSDAQVHDDVQLQSPVPPIANRAMKNKEVTPSVEQILIEGKIRNRAKTAARFVREVCLFQNRTKCNFQTAWDATRQREPEMFAEMADAQSK